MAATRRSSSTWPAWCEVARQVGEPQRRVLAGFLAAVAEQARLDIEHPADRAEVERALEAARREV